MSTYNRIESIAEDNVYGIGMAKISTEYGCDIFQRFLREGSILELGPADGIMTDRIFPEWKGMYTVVDGAQFYVNKLKEKYPQIDAQCSLFENFKPISKYDNIILGHILEHVDDSVAILKLVKTWLSDDGIVLCAVPNANSLHRQAAVLMEIQESTKSFSQKDIHHGHQRVYDSNTLVEDFLKAGYTIKATGGYWLKPLADKQIEGSWTEELIHAYMMLGEKYPEIAGEIYVVAEDL